MTDRVLTSDVGRFDGAEEGGSVAGGGDGGVELGLIVVDAGSRRRCLERLEGEEGRAGLVAEEEAGRGAVVPQLEAVHGHLAAGWYT